MKPASRIAVIDYGMGNLRSVAQALRHVAGAQAEVLVTGDAQQIRDADKVVFPGVGAMRDCMRALDAQGLRETVTNAAQEKPFLGICLGMQALFSHSEEGDVSGLGILPGRVRRFPESLQTEAVGGRLKVPHMGWNEVGMVTPHPLWAGIADQSRFYFVHSYYVQPDDVRLMAGSTAYPFAFASAVARDNLFAVQFHPEKSQQAGLALLGNFVSWNGKMT